MRDDDRIVWEAWGVLQNFAETNPEAPPYLREMVAGYKQRMDKAKRTRVPYPEFCRHPEKCASLSSCPRDPCCCD